MTHYKSLVESIEKFREALDKYKEAEEEYNKLSSKSDEVRKSFLKERAKVIAKDKGTEAEKEIKSLIEIEKSRKENRRIKKVVKKNHGGLNSILIPAITEYQRPYPNKFDHMNITHIWNRIEYNNGEDVKNWERVTDQHIVQGMLLQWQRSHFTQANDTPFASEFWRQKLQNEDIQDAILQRNLPTIHELPLEANEVLQEMKKCDSIPIIPDHTTLDDFRSFIKNIKESKSSSPSGRHYRQYKVLLGQDEQYLKVIHGMLQLALNHSVILNHWKKTITTLLEKKSEKPYIHKFRGIHIVEGDLQFLAKYFYVYKMIHNAEKENLISDEQYGGRKNRMAQTEH